MKNSKILLILFLISFSFIANGQVSYEPDETFIYKVTPQTTLQRKRITNHVSISCSKPGNNSSILLIG